MQLTTLTGPVRGWWTRRRALIAAVSTVTIGAAVAGGFQVFGTSTAESLLEPPDEYISLIQVEDDKTAQSTRETGFIYRVPGGPQVLKMPGECKTWHEYLVVQRAAIPAGMTAIRFTVRGESDKRLLLTGLRVEKEAKAPMAGIQVRCPVEGETQAREVTVDLDKATGAVQEITSYRTGDKEEKKDFQFTLDKNETETFEVVVTATKFKRLYEYTLVLEYTANGEKRKLRIAPQDDREVFTLAGSGRNDPAYISNHSYGWMPNWLPPEEGNRIPLGATLAPTHP